MFDAAALMKGGLTRSEAFVADLDLRMLEQCDDFAVVLDCIRRTDDDDEQADILRKLARILYYKGYLDAWMEPDTASLFLDHGYEVPGRRVEIPW